MYKVVVLKEEKNEDELTYWVTMHEISSADEHIIATTLRSIADRLSPSPRKSVIQGE